MDFIINKIRSGEIIIIDKVFTELKSSEISDFKEKISKSVYKTEHLLDKIDPLFEENTIQWISVLGFSSSSLKMDPPHHRSPASSKWPRSSRPRRTACSHEPWGSALLSRGARKTPPSLHSSIPNIRRRACIGACGNCYGAGVEYRAR